MKYLSGLKSSFSELYLMRVVMALTAVVLLIRSVEHYRFDRFSYIPVNVMFFIALLYTYRLLKIYRIKEAKHFFALSYSASTLLFFYLRGVDMIPWIMIYPMGAILLTGIIPGLFWSVGYFICIIFITVFNQDVIFNINYSLLLNESVNVFIVSIILGVFYERLRSNRVARLEYLSNKDVLTGIYNRRFFYEYALKELAKASRYDKKMSLLTLDVDNFKMVNDRFGHSVGDDVLKGIVNKILPIIRESDIFARFGGEEFVIMLFNADDSSGVMLSNKILELIRELRIGEVNNISVSIGLTSYLEGDTLDMMLKRSDDALYEAKRSGKDRLSVC